MIRISKWLLIAVWLLLAGFLLLAVLSGTNVFQLR
jgi:hypothetical protein